LQDSCDNSVAFINNSSNATSFNWNFGDGQSSTDPTPDHLYPSAGTYQVTLTASNNCDSQSITQTVTAAALNPATVGFTYSTDTCLRRLQFQSTSQNASSHDWSFGDGQGATGTIGVHTYSEFGLYTLTLVINNTQGCRAEATSLIDLNEPPAQVFIPNIFTPNGDGKNDVFEIKVTGGCSDGTYQIFSRWGDLVVESNSLHAPWDGKDVPGGIYMYTAQVGDMSYRGFLEIIK
jgi:gliding motility-associated-like protein